MTTNPEPIKEITELAEVEEGFLRVQEASPLEAIYWFISRVTAENFVETVRAYKPDLRATTGCIDIQERQIDEAVLVVIKMPTYL